MKRMACVLALTMSGCVFSGGPGGSPTPGSDAGDAGVTPDTGGMPDASGVDAAGGDAAIPDECGDGALQATEKCDPALPASSAGSCPIDCDDGNSCTADALLGSASSCSAVCASTAIEDCINEDGCCPSGCGPQTDTDCDENTVCGDGVVTGIELCDTLIPAGEAGACPETSEDCTPMVGQIARVIGQGCDTTCAYVAITDCTGGDDFCPTGCDSSNDADCQSVCGNGTVEPGESCDGGCPDDAFCAGQAGSCTEATVSGSAATCDAMCEFAAITACTNGDGCCPDGCTSAQDDDCSATCGDGAVDPLEKCDPQSAAGCPVGPDDCDDSNACTSDRVTGSASTCSAQCVNTAITACNATISDGCCPSSCTANTDVDCAAVCGNSVVEPGEKCDGNCPSCDDGDSCTADSSTGSAANCDLVCTNSAITMCVDGDGCCPASCNAVSDDDCSPVCGNSVEEPGETCDGNCPASCDDGQACTVDTRSGGASTCNVTCKHTAVTTCIDDDGCCPSTCSANNDNDCSATCGNGVVEAGEECDGSCPTSCPTCQTLSGSGCQRKCVAQQGCTPCSINGSCPCSAGQICSGGKCVTGSSAGQCGSACSPDAYCQAFANSPYCSGGGCVECRDDDDCAGDGFCVGGTCGGCSGDLDCDVTGGFYCNPSSMRCEVPTSCNDAQNPGEWCRAQGFDLCDTVTGDCVVAECSSDSECGEVEFCDASGQCVTAPKCNEASEPDAWCTRFATNSQANICVFGTCKVGCTTPCDCPSRLYDTCVNEGGSQATCLRNAPSCHEVCDGDALCQQRFPDTPTCGGSPQVNQGCCGGMVGCATTL